ncbi:hypothetical protein PJL18_03883 [Paenarthrobacter nicotinovorans]|nr:hypothetical protein [Paenarthrobacter nicotinovorans]
MKPSRQGDGPCRQGGFCQSVQGFKNCQEVCAAVVFPAVLAPPFQQLQAQLLMAGEDTVPTLHQRNCQSFIPFPRGNAQAAGDEFADQDSGLHGDCAGEHEVVVAAFRDVIVVPVEGPLRNPGGSRERMELIQRSVRNEVRKHGSVRGPQGRIDVDGHGQSVVPGEPSQLPDGTPAKRLPVTAAGKERTRGTSSVAPTIPTTAGHALKHRGVSA